MDNILPGRFTHPPQISIDSAVCDQEGLCVRVCADQIFQQPAPHAVPEVIHPELCSLCGHCLAVCPADAISHSGLDQNNFSPALPEHKIGSEQFIPFSRLRRSVRNYHPSRRVSMEQISILLEAARYAPTGCNAQALEYVIVQKPELHDQLFDLCLDAYRSLIQGFMQARTAAAPDLSRHDIHLLQMILDEAQEGRDSLFYRAPVIIIIHAPRSTPTPLEDAALATYQMMLTAHSLDLGTCYIGNFYLYANYSEEIRSFLSIPDQNRFVSCLTVGYPAIRYRKMVDRESPSVCWM